MDKTKVLAQIRQTRLLPVIRTNNSEDALALVDAIVEGGVSVLEITMTVPNAVQIIHDLTNKYQDQALIGAGTVLDSEAALRCLDAGAQFIVSPLTDFDVIRICNESGVAVFPGAMTVTEIYRARLAGADAVKVFPANALGGATYLKTVKTVLPNVEIIPTGGINLTTITDYLRAGVLAVGVGSELANTQTLHSDGTEAITQQTRNFLSATR